MTMQSYHVLMNVRPDFREQAKPMLDELFGMWRKYADECDWEDTGACEIVLRYDQASGDLAFDSGGERDVPQWLTDDTVAILKDVGRNATCPTVVRRTTDGRPTDFAVGQTVEEKAQALFNAKLESAVEVLEEIKPGLDQELAGEVERLQVALQAHLQLTSG